MNHWPSFVMCLLGFGALALAAERQQEMLFDRALGGSTTRWLRLVGWAALVLALVESVQEQGWALGLVTYSGLTSLAAGVVFLGLVGVGRWVGR